MTPLPAVSVVVPTRDREERLRDLLSSLRGQSIGNDAFEVVVVDDCSSDSTSALLKELQGGEIEVRWLRRSSPQGPGAARNAGWRMARAPIIAFTDDDCVATTDWLEAGLAACRAHPGCIIQGRTEPIPEEAARLDAFAYTVSVDRLGPQYETCNIFYPRDLLERHGDFDAAAFPAARGEDCDLAWRMIEAGVEPVFAPHALIQHAVHELGPFGQLRRAVGWGEVMLAFARHPGFRRARLHRGLYWEPQHRLVLRAAVGVALPRRLRHLRSWLVMPYVRNLLRHRVRDSKRGPIIAPFLVLLDLVEVGAVVQGSLRHGTLVI
jgi:glycosyltransferase involved in cell wall biosynthesis